MLGAGKHKEQLVFSKPERISNGSGGFETTYVPYLTTLGDTIHKGVSNDLIAQGLDLIETFEAKIRYRQDHIISVGHRVSWRGRVCEILGFPTPERKDYIRILLKTINESTSAEV